MASASFGISSTTPEERAQVGGTEEEHPAADLPRKLYHRERAAGVDARIQSFLDWWEESGPFAIVVPPLGGIPTDEATQRALFEAKRTKADTLARRGAGQLTGRHHHRRLVLALVAVGFILGRASK